MIFIVVIPAIAALCLLVWSCASMFREVRARQRLSLKYCLACGFGLLILDAFLCAALQFMAGMGHSTGSHVDVVCTMSFILLVVAPMTGLLMYRRAHPRLAEKGSITVEGERRQDWRRAISEAMADKTVVKDLKGLGIAGLVCGLLIALILGVWFGAGPLLLYAARHGNASLAMLLVDAGVNVHGRDDRFMTPLMHAAKNGHTDLVRLLLDNGADVNFGLGNAPPLFHAIESGRGELVDHLLKRGADINYRERYGAIPVIYAGQYGTAKVMEALLNHGADINARDDIGRTVLMRAVLCNRFDVVEVLLKRGADLTARDREGKTALGLRWYGDGPPPNDRIVHLLIQHGATR